VLGKRLARYGLTLHPDKTRFVDFRNNRRIYHADDRACSTTPAREFDMLTPVQAFLERKWVRE